MALNPAIAVTEVEEVVVGPAPAAAVRLVIAGAMMGIGLLAFNAAAVSREIEASVSIPIMDTGMLLVSVLAAVLFFAEPITLRKCAGLALLVAGIAVLRPE